MIATRTTLILAVPALLAVLAGCTAAPATPTAASAPTPAASPASAAPVVPSTPSPSATPVVGPTAGPPVTAQQTTAATVSVTKLLDATAVAATSPKPGGALDAGLDDTLGGALRADIQAQLAELADNGWTSTGTAVAEDVRVLGTSTKKGVTTLTVEACVDSSHVVVSDADGKPLPTDPAHARAETIYTVTDDGSGPIVTNRTFPNDPTC